MDILCIIHSLQNAKAPTMGPFEPLNFEALKIVRFCNHSNNFENNDNLRTFCFSANTKNLYVLYDFV